MKEYTSPEIEFIELDDIDICAASSCTDYVCPQAYGNICPGNPYGGT